MRWNDDYEDFDASDFDAGEPDEEALEDIRREEERIKAMPIMQKAKAILDITEALMETLPEDDIAEHYKHVMLEDALILNSRILGAEGADLYTLRMENAVAIKVAARNLVAQTSGLNMMGLSDPRYVQVLQDEINEFRLMFIDWVKSFDRTKDIRDNWGLFYD